MRISDWSSDVCSSDLERTRTSTGLHPQTPEACASTNSATSAWVAEHSDLRVDSRLRLATFLVPLPPSSRGLGRCPLTAETDRKSVVSGKSVSVRVDRGGRRIIKKKKNISKGSR